MKVAFLVDYYPPFTPGGSEWSIYYLAKQLKLQNVESVIITPNYGTLDEEVINQTKVIRFPIIKKLKTDRSVINPIWQNNPLFFLVSGYHIYQIAKKNRIEVLHVNGKFLIPGSWIASKILKIPLIVTIRDKQLLCSYGKCFFEDNRFRACSFWEYLTQDMPWFYQNYVGNKNLSSKFYLLFSAVYTRIAHNLIKFFAIRANRVVAISKSQKTYMEKNGFKDVKVIYNSASFESIKKNTKRDGILFAGKLSLGKGAYLLLNAVPAIIKDQKIKFYFAGGIENKSQIMNLINNLKIKNKVVLLGGVDHHKLQRLFQTSKLVVMPSIYPEAFGRVALEALASGTPVVVVDKGGLPEIIDSGFNGEVSKTESSDLAVKVLQVLKNNIRYINNVTKSHNALVKKFEVVPIKQHINLYNQALRTQK